MSAGVTSRLDLYRLWRLVRPVEGAARSALVVAESAEHARRLCAAGTYHPDVPAQDDPQRRRVEPDADAWNDPERSTAMLGGSSSSSYAGIVHREFNWRWPEVMTPRAVYALPVQSVEEPWAIEQDLAPFVTEVEWHTAGVGGERLAERIRVDVLADPYVDGTRVFRLLAVYFDAEPVMILQIGGRSGRDHLRRFITDPARYGLLLGWIVQLLPVPEDSEPDNVVLGLDDERTDLVEFYSGNVLEAQAADTKRKQTRGVRT